MDRKENSPQSHRQNRKNKNENKRCNEESSSKSASSSAYCTVKYDCYLDNKNVKIRKTNNKSEIVSVDSSSTNSNDSRTSEATSTTNQTTEIIKSPNVTNFLQPIASASTSQLIVPNHSVEINLAQIDQATNKIDNKPTTQFHEVNHYFNRPSKSIRGIHQ